MMNVWTGVGRVGKEPETRTLQSGTTVTTFSIAIKRYTKDKDKNITDWINVEAWGSRGDYVKKYIHKGNLVSVQGALHVNSYKAQDGSNHTNYSINADEINNLTPRDANGNSAPANVPAPGFTEIDDDDLPF